MSEQKDYLKVDPPIPGQDWVCLSFVSPDDMVEKKTLFSINRFLYHRVNRNVSDQATQMARDLNTIYNRRFTERVETLRASRNEDDRFLADQLDAIKKSVQIDENEFISRCMRKFSIDQDEITDQYKMYLVENQAELDREFDIANEGRTSIRGVKVRGVFHHREEAQRKANDLRQNVEPAHDVFVAPVGYWLPWNPSADSIQDQEHMIPELNNMMKKYYDNVQEKNQHYEERKRELQEQAEASTGNATRDRLRKKLMQRREQKLKREAEQAMGIGSGKGSK